MTSEQLVCPMKIGPYHLKGTIGQGAFATVKLAFNVETEKYFACKIIRKQRIQSQHQKESFIREIRILQQMRSPHIVSLYDLLKDSLNYYVFIEFCPNGDLFGICVAKKQLTEDEARIYFREILLGMKFIHSNNVGHRDLKPENIMIDAEGHAKISDFGLSKFVSNENKLTTTACGSPCYTAPEIIAGKSYDPRVSDMWSLGVVLYAMVTGQLPWTKRNKLQLFHQIRRADYHIPSTLSPQITILLKNLMNKNPEQRPTVDDALASDFMTMVPSSEVNMSTDILPYVSLRKVDRFLEIDVETEVPPPAPKRCCSSENLSGESYQKTVRYLFKAGSEPASRRKGKMSIVNCVSNFTKVNNDLPPPSFEQPDIQSIMKNCMFKRSQKAKIVRPITVNKTRII